MKIIFKRIGLFWALSGVCVAAEATSPGCPTVDLRKSFPIQVRNQGDISWCYAHTAADYLQFFNRVPEQISAADIAIEYSGRLWPRMLQVLRGDEVPQYGFVRSALWDALDQGYCPESAFPSESWKRVMVASGLLTAELEPLPRAFGQIFELHRKIQSGDISRYQDLPFYFEFEGVGQKRFFEILRDAERESLLSDLRDAACEGRRQPYPRSIDRISMQVRSKTTLRRIRQRLESGMPVSIDYFDGVLENSKSFKRKLSTLHTSLVMGQRFDPLAKECQFLVKNSFGKSCEGYDPELACEEGYLWVGESALHRALVSTVSIFE